MANDNQITCGAGEFLAVGKLFKKGLQVTFTVGNAKSIDIFAHNPTNEKTYTVQVKTEKKSKKDFFLKEEDIKDNHIYIFVALNDFENNEDYFIIKGSEMRKDVKKFFGPKKSAVRHSSLNDYKDNWKVFDQ